jgi:hypothetical protein
MTQMTKKDYTLPYQELAKFISPNLRNSVNVSITKNLFDRFLTQNESAPFYGYVGNNPGTVTQRLATDVEQDINHIVPLFSFNQGKEEFIFTEQDLVNKAKAIGLTANLEDWLAAQGNNFCPPISLDKFTNFFNYYYTANALDYKPVMGWNQTNAPEYYCIEKPANGSLTKLNVDVATTEFIVPTGTGFANQLFTVTCVNNTVSELQFSVANVGALGGWVPVSGANSFTMPKINSGLVNTYTHSFAVSKNGVTKTLITFDIVCDPLFDTESNLIGYESFNVGDTLSIDAKFISSVYSVSFTGSTGIKGKVKNVKTLAAYQVINNVQLQKGMRVLVKNNAGSENGIYTVSEQSWSFAEDFTAGSNVNAEVFDIHGQSRYRAVSVTGGYSFVQSGSTSLTNDWQEHNYWMHISEVNARGLDLAKIQQAVRPIIEYKNSVQLNSFVANGRPASSGTAYQQTKQKFNQFPLFDLFNHDGTHSGFVSPIFFYEESVNGQLDVKLQKRVAKSDFLSADFLFNHGLMDGDKALFFKEAGQMKSIWTDGYSSSTIISSSFTGTGNGTISVQLTGKNIPEQIWTLNALNASSFKLTGNSFSGNELVSIGQLYSNEYFTIQIVNGSIPFQVNDSYTFVTAGKNIPEWVVKQNDKTNMVLLSENGTYTVPMSFVHNVKNEHQATLQEGALYSHFRDILNKGVSNKFGGAIKSWNDPVNIFIGLMMQKDINPLSLIDYAQRSYESASNSVIDLYVSKILQYVADVKIPSAKEFADYALSELLKSRDVKQVFYDTTSLAGFPITLPMMGFTAPVMPQIVHVNELDGQFIQHHDGHKSPLFADTYQLFERMFSNKTTVNKNGAEVEILLSTTVEPTTPFKGAMWINNTSSASSIKLFDVTSDANNAPSNPSAGTTWLNTQTNQAFEYDGTGWIYKNKSDLWKEMKFGELLNSIIIEIESRLYDRCYASPINLSIPNMEQEYISWATANKYKPYASIASEDPFSWNYSSIGQARWFDVITAYQSTHGISYPTARPDLAPWQLLNHASKPANWDIQYKAKLTDLTGYTNSITVSAVSFSETPTNVTRFGLPVMDGVQLSNGDYILLASEALPSNNGIWQVSTGSWTQVSFDFNTKLLFTVRYGSVFANTIWGNITNQEFAQYRKWSNKMWADIKAVTSVKLFVNTVTDENLPPYLPASDRWANEVLTNVIPTSWQDEYQFGDNSLLESVWKNSIDYKYNEVKAYCKVNPLGFIENLWGINYLIIDGIRYDYNAQSLVSLSNLKMHGDAIDSTRTHQVVGTVNKDVKLVNHTRSVGYPEFCVFDGDVFVGKLIANQITNGTMNGVTFTNFGIKDNGSAFQQGDMFIIANSVVSFVPATTKQYIGFGQLFANALRSMSVDTNRSYAVSAFKNWQTTIGYRTGRMIAENCVVETGTTVIPESAYSLKLKKNRVSNSLWMQALNVSVLSNSGPKENWTYQIDGFNPNQTEFQYYHLDPSSEEITFNVLDTELVLSHYSEIANLVKTTFPTTIQGLLPLVNVLFGYSMFLEANGFTMDDNDNKIEADSGRFRNWQLEIEKMVSNLDTVGLNDPIQMNPFMDGFTIEHGDGLTAEFVDTDIFDVKSHPAIFDLVGAKISVRDLFVVRTADKTVIKSEVPIYSAHVQFDEYENIFKFEKQIGTDKLLFDEFSGARISTLTFNGRGSANETMRPEFGGHFISDNASKLNLQASIDAIANAYNPDKQFDPTISKHALALLGFSQKDYLSNIGVDMNTQLAFWRGMIQMKGTTSSVNALLNHKNYSGAKIDEYWAVKIAEYGDAREKTYPELKVFAADTYQHFTKYQFGDNSLSGFTFIDPIDDNRWFALPDLNKDMTFSSKTTYYSNNSASGLITIPSGDSFINGTATYQKLNDTTLKITGTGTVNVSSLNPDVDKYNPIKLFNYQANEHVTDICYWHPKAGYHSAAISAVDIISNTDPAKYSNLVTTDVNEYFSWSDKEIGRIWFDTDKVAYQPYDDSSIYPDIDQRLIRWGGLADYASVSINEWVESDVIPSAYTTYYPAEYGQPSNEAVYQREKAWQVRPIAWSQAGVAIAAAHPAFNAAFFPSITFDNQSGTAWLESGSFADLGIKANMHVGTWTNTPVEKPLSEYKIIANDSKTVLLDNILPNQQTITKNGLTVNVSIKAIGSTKKLGQLLFVGPNSNASLIQSVQRIAIEGTLVNQWEVTASIRVIEIDTGDFVDVPINTAIGSVNSAPYYGTSDSMVQNDTVVGTIENFNLQITLTALNSVNNMPIDTLANIIEEAFSSRVTLHDTISIQQIVPNTVNGVICNDPQSPDYTGIEWRSWSMPAQADLDDDSPAPNSKWKPYIGDYVSVQPVTFAMIADATNPDLVLSDSTIIPRYKTSWNDWVELTPTHYDFVAQTTVSTIQVMDVDSARIAVYFNGIAQSNTYSKIGTTMTINCPIGTFVKVIISVYQPTQKELAFNPDVADDVKVQTQFKRDFKYVTKMVRDNTGLVSGNKYYFWVTNRNLGSGQLSVNQIKQQLTTAPSAYFIIHHLVNGKYDSVIISGLNYLVPNSDEYKLRFTRDYTLRTDSNDLDLKDVHTEWTLIRPGQRTKIPEQLWNKLVDSVCGQDSAGNSVPYEKFVSYDAKYGKNSKYGFGVGQVLADKNILIETIKYVVQNTSLVVEGDYPIPDYISFIDFAELDSLFSGANIRETMNRIWNLASVAQINEVFFACLEDVIASNYELTDVFKTSRLSAYGIRVVS